MPDEPDPMNDDRRLDDLARRILDGKRVDWKAEGSQGPADDEAMLAELRVLADIVELHRRDCGGRDPQRSGAEAQSAAGASAVGRWGTLTLVEKVGEGAFAEVYRARDPHLDRDVALKLLRHSGPSPGLGAAILEEGKLLAAVRHPNVVVVHGAGIFDGRVGIWTEFVQGQTLEDVLADHGPFGAHEAMRIGIDLCRALAAVHESGVIHRDVKARNVMRERGGRLVLVDFGMGAAATESRDDRAVSGGTPLYMAPELLEGRAATVPSDIYALGVLLWHLLTGAYPVTGSDVGEVRQAHLAGHRLRLRDERPDLPAAVVATVERAVAPDSTRRFATAGDMEAALVKALRASEATTRPTRPTAEDGLRPQTRRRAWLVTMSIIGLVVLSSIAIHLTRPANDAAGVTPTRPGSTPTAPQSPATATQRIEEPGFRRAAERAFDAGSRPAAPRPDHLPRSPAPAAAPPFVFGERDSILVGAFENRTDVAALDGTIGFAVERDLGTTPGISVVPRARVIDTLRLMKRPDAAVIDQATGLEVCLRDGGIRALLTGRVEKVGSRFALSANLFDATRRGQSVGAVRAEAESLDALLGAVHALADQVRTAIGEVPAASADAEAPLEHATTTSLTALQLYSQAVQAGSAEQWAVSAQLANAAVAEDPSFASAHAWLARSLLATGKGAEARAALERAVTHAGGVSGRERMLILAMHEDAQRHRDEAIAAYEAYLRAYPDDIWALDSLVMLYGAASDKVARLKVRAAELRPRSFKANREAAVWLMAQRGDLARARPFVERARALLDVDPSPTYRDWVRFEPAFEDWLRGDLRGMAARLDRLLSADPQSPECAMFAAGLYHGLGRLRAAEHALERVPASQWRQGLALNRDVERAWIAFHRQDSAAVSAWADALTQARPLPWPSFHAVWMLRRMDRVDDAAAIGRARAAEGPELDWVTGDLALGSGDVDTASTRIAGTWPEMAAGNPVTLMAAETYAEALERQGKLENAITVLEDATRDRVRLYQAMRSSIPHWLRVRARLAAGYRAAGRPADARRVEAELRGLLALADPEFVLLKQLPQ